ncbi:AAA family ATPase [Fundidesulfovibrio soli]|uniref:AAA family ATPase n=1 Tax=Fundidesulfovibrio soli TaxID=2922716 RepID=UPI003014F0F6
MILRLTLTDFMAHKATTLDLAPGLNVLCGPNNTGKSALVEALRCLATNPSRRHCIRHGATEARVEALLDDGWRVAWVRRKAYAIYELHPPGEAEPQIFAKLGKGGVPEEVARRLRLPLVSFEKGEDVDVHLGDQRHPIFLLDRPGSVLADFLASSTESAHLMAMQDLLREKVRRARTDSRRLEESLAATGQGLDRLDALPGLSLRLEDLRVGAEALAGRAAAVPRLEARLGKMRGLSTRSAQLQARLTLLEGLSAPAAPAPAAPLAEATARLRALQERTRAAQAASAALLPLAAPPALAPAGQLAQASARLERLRAQRDGAERRGQALTALATPPPLADPAPLARLAGAMATLAARIAKGQAWLAGREAELAALGERIAHRLEQVGECPLCGADLDAAKFLKKRTPGHEPT